MYTSGSTGEPKGVAVPHRAISRLVRDTDYVQLGPDDRMAQVSNASFDAATFEVWGALLNGGQLVGIDKDVALSAELVAKTLRSEGITVMFLTTALFNQLSLGAPGIFEPLRSCAQRSYGGAALAAVVGKRATRAAVMAAQGVLARMYGHA